MKSAVIKYIKNMSGGHRLFWLTLIFYIFLLIANPSNKVIAASFVVLFATYLKVTKKFFDSLFFTYLASLIVQTGKTYAIQLVPPGIFPLEIFPNGYFTSITVSAFHFITFVMLLLCIRKIVLVRKNFKPVLSDLLVVILYVLKILSAVMASDNGSLSLPFELLSLSGFAAYFYVRLYINPDNKVWSNTIHILGALVVFQSVLGLSQYVAKSPLYKNIETQVNIEYYGNAIDETQFTFRPVGTFDHANSLGIWLASVCTLLIVYALKNKSNLIWLSFCAGFILMIGTISRSAWLGFSAGILFTIYVSRKRYGKYFRNLKTFALKNRFAILPVLFILTLMFIIPRFQNSLYSFQTESGGLFFRKIQLADAIEIIKLHPLLGIGAGMSVYEGISLNLFTMSASIPLQIHNWYLNIGTENGLLTLFAALILILNSLKNLIKPKGQTFIKLSVAGAIVSASVAATLQPYINFQLLLVLLSLTNGDNMKPIKDGKENR